jgi:hypothetical protein
MVYFENVHQDKSNNILYANILMYILKEKDDQNRSYE